METAHLLRSPANAARLLESIKSVNAGKTVELDPTAETDKPKTGKRGSS